MRGRFWAQRMSWNALVALCLLATPACQSPMNVPAATSAGVTLTASMPDLSGLAWIDGDLFLAVHDAKNRKEPDLPRVSLLTLPASSEGVLWRPVDVAFPDQASNDLESAARIPGTSQVLLAESGDNGGAFTRIFRAELRGDAVEILDTARWSEFTKPYNVEAIAVAGNGPDEWLFIWAERNSGQISTDLKWTKLRLDPFRIGGTVSSIAFTLPQSAYDTRGAPLYSRPLVAMDIDSAGQIYIAAALDPEEISQTPDNGPFRSIIYKIGGIDGDRVVLDPQPRVIAVLDALKVESLAVRERQDQRELFVGTDDENYGGILRLLPATEVQGP